MIEIKTDTKGKLTKESEDKLAACTEAAVRKYSAHIRGDIKTGPWTQTEQFFTSDRDEGNPMYTVCASTARTEDPCTYRLEWLRISADGTLDSWTWKPTPLEEYTIGCIGTEPKEERPSGMTFQDAEDRVNCLFDDLFASSQWKRPTITSAADLDIAEVDINYMLEDTAARAMRQLGIGRFAAEVDGKRYTLAEAEHGMSLEVETKENGTSKTSEFFDIGLDLQFALCRAVLEKAEPLQ